MSKEQILADLKTSVETWNIKLAQDATNAAIAEGISIGDIIGDGLGKGMEVVGERFDKAEIFLPQVVAASKTMEAALKILEPLMSKGEGALKGTVVMATVEGDIHEIGKNVCCAMLRGAGFKVIDLGTDVSPYAFEKAIEESNADVVGGSALMTTSLYQQKDMVRVFNEDKLPVITIFGGAPCSEEWVNEIGGDGYSASGSEIVELVRRLLSEKPDGSE